MQLGAPGVQSWMTLPWALQELCIFLTPGRPKEGLREFLGGPQCHVISSALGRKKE